jgi:hypothetical protein
MRRPAFLAVAVVFCALLGAPGQGRGHQVASPADRVAPTGASPAGEERVGPAAAASDEKGARPNPRPGALASAWLGLAALAAVGARRAGRRAVAIAALASLSWLAFESGVHSVHHLGDDKGIGQCSVAAATSTTIASPVESSPWTVAPPPALTGLPEIASSHPDTCPLPTSPARAPPPLAPAK